MRRSTQRCRGLYGDILVVVSELACNTGIFAKSTAMLANAEEHTALSRALSQLAEIEEKVEQLHHSQADNDYFTLSELVKDYIFLIQAVKVNSYTSSPRVCTYSSI